MQCERRSFVGRFGLPGVCRLITLQPVAQLAPDLREREGVSAKRCAQVHGRKEVCVQQSTEQRAESPGNPRSQLVSAADDSY